MFCLMQTLSAPPFSCTTGFGPRLLTCLSRHATPTPRISSCSTHPRIAADLPSDSPNRKIFLTAAAQQEPKYLAFSNEKSIRFCAMAGNHDVDKLLEIKAVAGDSLSDSINVLPSC